MTDCDYEQNHVKVCQEGLDLVSISELQAIEMSGPV